MYKIAHIDSSMFFRNFFSDVVYKMGFLYRGYETYDAFFNSAKDDRPDIIFTAFEFGNTNAIDFMRKLNESEFYNIPVIVITGNSDIENRERLFNLGITDYLSKSDINYDSLKKYLNLINIDDQLINKLRNINIAVVDDSSVALTLIKNIFTKKNILNVDYYNDSKTLLNSGKKYTIYLLDLVLPEMSGEELLMKLKENNKNCIIIMISSISNYKTMNSVLLTGADDYIIKPFDSFIFMVRLKNNLKNYLLKEELENMNNKLKYMSERDSLTNLYNHQTIINKIQQSYQKEKNNLYIVMFDIDNFKNINDMYGHTIGDEVLVSISNLLQNESKIVAGRYGGEEFIFYFYEKDDDNAKDLSEIIRLKISKLDFSVSNLKITISGGLIKLSDENIGNFIKDVDNLLYQAKKSGKNKIITKL